MCCDREGGTGRGRGGEGEGRERVERRVGGGEEDGREGRRGEGRGREGKGGERRSGELVERRDRSVFVWHT